VMAFAQIPALCTRTEKTACVIVSLRQSSPRYDRFKAILLVAFSPIQIVTLQLARLPPPFR
jgi:hypothetical protein